MATTINDIRFAVVRETGSTAIEHESVIQWCNDCNVDIGSVINVPADTFQIPLTTTDMTYALPEDLKEINRLWLESDLEFEINRDLRVNYRIYNGKIEFRVPFRAEDTLNIDYYKFLIRFTEQDDEIDIPDRYASLYVSYCKMRYFELFSTQTNIGLQIAQRNSEFAAQMYNAMRNQIIQYYSFTNPDLVIKERW
ncbi:hypothetical protein [Paenibacillus agaridevorans]|uniref:phage adaptor protein n=1 Tax=Paenibacillus agaridevorans TaxID=171404 RepID=UPI001BE4A07D|nr:hypothetical protein [Paenibacillus agaridevorans]